MEQLLSELLDIKDQLDRLERHKDDPLNITMFDVYIARQFKILDIPEELKYSILEQIKVYYYKRAEEIKIKIKELI